MQALVLCQSMKGGMKDTPIADAGASSFSGTIPGHNMMCCAVRKGTMPMGKTKLNITDMHISVNINNIQTGTLLI